MEHIRKLEKDIKEGDSYNPPEDLSYRCGRVYDILSSLYYFSPPCIVLPNKLIADLNNKN